jgi:hypothetical protein
MFKVGSTFIQKNGVFLVRTCAQQIKLGRASSRLDVAPARRQPSASVSRASRRPPPPEAARRPRPRLPRPTPPEAPRLRRHGAVRGPCAGRTVGPSAAPPVRAPAKAPWYDGTADVTASSPPSLRAIKGRRVSPPSTPSPPSSHCPLPATIEPPPQPCSAHPRRRASYLAPPLTLT